jgi:hypothetical protein
MDTEGEVYMQQAKEKPYSMQLIEIFPDLGSEVVIEEHKAYRHPNG